MFLRGDSVKQWGFLMIIASLVVIVFSPIASGDEETTLLREEAVKYYKRWRDYEQQADLEKAIEKFNEFLLKRPSDQDALELREKAGRDMMIHMLMQGGEIARIARAILLYAEQRPPIRMETDKEQIKKLVEMVAAGNLYQRHEAMTLLQTQVGELAIPAMLTYLSKKDDQKIQIILAITRLGRTAVVPLIEVLNAEDYEMRQHVCILLGHIADIRSLPELKRVLENPKEKEEVKKYAEEAIRKITQKASISLAPAKELYYQKAMAYYRDDSDYKPLIGFKNQLYWRWENGRLLYKELAPFVYNEIMAEHACYQALQLDPTSSKVWALLARVYYSEYTRVKVLEDAYAAKDIDFSEEVRKEVDMELPYTNKAKYIVASTGSEILYEALQAALRENRPEVTVAVLEDIGEISKGRGDIPAPVLQALQSLDRRIRYAAAEALVKISPAQSFSGASRVVETLQEALSEWDSQSVLVIEDNDAARNSLVGILRKMNLNVFGAANGVEGLQRAKMAPPDLIIMSAELENLERSFQYLLNAFQDDNRTKDIPMLLVCPEARVAQRKIHQQKVPVIQEILPKLSGHTLFLETTVTNEVTKALQKAKGRYHSKAKENIAIRAVTAIALIPQGNKTFDLKPASNSLRLLLRRNPAIRMPAIVALGNLGDTESIPALEKILEEDENIDIRTKACWALGQIFNKSRVKVEKEQTKRLLQILQKIENNLPEMQDNSDSKIKMESLRRNIFYLIGQANIAPEDRRDVFSVYRVHGPIEIPKDMSEKVTRHEGEKTEGEKTEGEKTEGEKTEGEKTEGEKTEGEGEKSPE